MDTSFENALTPEEWCKKLAGNGVSISVRTLRSQARIHGKFYSLGRAMMLNSDHIEFLLSVRASMPTCVSEKQA